MRVDIRYLVSENADLLIVALFPLCILAAFYGYKHAVELISGKSDWIKPITTGFKLGFLYAVFVESAGFVTETLD